MAYQPAEHETPRTKPISSLFTDLYRETMDLIRGEVRLAKAEMSEKVSQVESGFVSLIAAYVFSLLGVLILLASAVIALANVVEPWLSALIVGGVVLIIGMIMLGKAKRNLKAKNLMPNATIESLKKDSEALKEHAR